MKGFYLIIAGIAVLIIGFFMILAGMLMSANKKNVEGGGVIMIGPIPIVFGTSYRMATLAIILTMALIFLWIILAIMWRKLL